jgi:hypothetical protein
MARLFYLIIGQRNDLSDPTLRLFLIATRMKFLDLLLLLLVDRDDLLRSRLYYPRKPQILLEINRIIHLFIPLNMASQGQFYSILLQLLEGSSIDRPTGHNLLDRVQLIADRAIIGLQG